MAFRAVNNRITDSDTEIWPQPAVNERLHRLTRGLDRAIPRVRCPQRRPLGLAENRAGRNALSLELPGRCLQVEAALRGTLARRPIYTLSSMSRRGVP
jgi:hypothetical protein